MTALIVVAVLAWGAGPAGAVIEDPDIDSSAHYRYSVNVERGVVEVNVELTITAAKPNVTTDESIFQYFFQGYNLLIPAEADELQVIDSSGVALSHQRDAGEETDSDILTIDFRRNIFFGQSARLTVSFTLPTGEAGSDNIARVNPAYASFVAWTSPIIEQATVTVVIPDGFEDRSTGPQPFALERTDDQQQLVAPNVDPETYYAVVSVANDDALDEDVVPLADAVLDPDRSVEGATGNIRVRSWPGDDGWRTHVINGVENGLPKLVELVGQPWPIEEELTITESFSPYLYGYAGWYDPETDIIEVGDERDEHVLYHELSHVWFNRDLFLDRWITEGLADFYAAETVAALGGERPEPFPTSLNDVDAIPLLDFEFPDQPEQEQWAYSASWGVMEQVVAEIGIEGLAEVVAAAEERELSYRGDGEPETVRTVADWRRFLDLVENQQQVAEGPVTQLIDQWVLADDQGALGADLLDDRAEARRRYLTLTETGDEWAPPFGVREAMMQWRFPKAGELMTASEAHLARRDAIIDTVTPAGAELPARLEPLYEAIDGDDAADDELSQALDETEAAGAEVREAHDRAEADRSLLQRLGLVGTDVEAEQAEAVTAFSAGQLAAATTEADEVDAIIDGAGRNGLYRVLGTVALVLLLAAGVWFLLLRPRRLRRVGPDPSPDDDLGPASGGESGGFPVGVAAGDTARFPRGSAPAPTSAPTSTWPAAPAPTGPPATADDPGRWASPSIESPPDSPTE